MVVKLTSYPNAHGIIHSYNRRIGCALSEEQLSEWIDKILKIGDPLAIIKHENIVAFLLLYCNKFDTLEAYICNVYVEEQFRGCKLSKKLVEEAIAICKSRDFKTINLDVAENNIAAIKVYSQCGFVETDRYFRDKDTFLQMTYTL